MSDYSWLREAQFERIKPYFPLSHGVPRVDDRRVVSGIIHVIRNGLRWRDDRNEGHSNVEVVTQAQVIGLEGSDSLQGAIRPHARGGRGGAPADPSSFPVHRGDAPPVRLARSRAAAPRPCSA